MESGLLSGGEDMPQISAAFSYLVHFFDPESEHFVGSLQAAYMQELMREVRRDGDA